MRVAILLFVVVVMLSVVPLLNTINMGNDLAVTPINKTEIKIGDIGIVPKSFDGEAVKMHYSGRQCNLNAGFEVEAVAVEDSFVVVQLSYIDWDGDELGKRGDCAPWVKFFATKDAFRKMQEEEKRIKK